jgi:hypothetical protein
MITDETTLFHYLHPSGVVKFYRKQTNGGPFPSENNPHWKLDADRCKVHQHGKKVDDVDPELARELFAAGKLDSRPGAWIPIDERTLLLEIEGTPAAPKATTTGGGA